MEMSREAFRALPPYTVLPAVVSVATLETMRETVALLQGVDTYAACRIKSQFEHCIQDFEFCIQRSQHVKFSYKD